MKNPAVFRKTISELAAEFPELFPKRMASGFWLHSKVVSRKSGMTMRRIELKQTGAVYQIRPSFLLPYGMGKTEAVEKALFLCQFGVPFEALAYVFGRDAGYWYRAYLSLGRPSLVGTTVKQPDRLPRDLAADEKHSWNLGERVYVGTTVGAGVFLGIGVAESASTAALTKVYQEFKTEAQELQPGYVPETVNTDGWEPTQQAWKKLFPSVTLMLCFLHAVLSLQNRCRSLKTLCTRLTNKVWNIYHATTKDHFSQRIRRLREWATKTEVPAPVREKLLDLCRKAPVFKQHFAFPTACRTSNSVDRLMKYLDRVLFVRQYFNGTSGSARLSLRAMALIWNFHPYGSRLRHDQPHRVSPFHDLNGFQYHSNWLQNLLIAASMDGHRP